MKCCVCHFPITEAEARPYLERTGVDGKLDPLPPRHGATKCWDLAHTRIRDLTAALVAVCERGDTDHSAKSMYWIASDALKAAGLNSNSSPASGEVKP